MINNRQQRSLIIKGIMLLLAFIVMIFAATLAWFAPPDLPAVANGISVSTTTGKYFDMAVGFQSSKNGYQYTMSQYTKNLNLRDVITANDEHYDVLHDFSPVDITGDGVTFVRPSMQLKNKDIDRTSNTFTTVTPNKEYISFDMYFRSDEVCKVYLDEDSYVKGAIEVEPGDGNLVNAELLAEGGGRKANEGNFSKDAVVGAVRVSFVNYDQFIEAEDLDNLQNEASVLWLPRPDIHLNSTANATLEPWTLSTGLTPDNTVVDRYGTTDKFDGFPADTFTHHYYSYALADDGQMIGDIDYDEKKTITDISNKLPVCDVNYKSGDYYYGKTKVNIWIEGCDAEARRAISGGQFQVNFDLAGG